MKRSIVVVAALATIAGLGAVATAETEALGSSSDVTAEELIGGWIDALGGLTTYHPFTSARYTLTTELYDPETDRLRRARPRYVTMARTERGQLTRIERWEGDDFIEQGWDGQTQWATMNGEPLGPGDKDYDEVPYVSGDVHYWIGLPFKLHDPGVNLHYRGRDDDGRHLVGVTFGQGIGLHDGDAWRYWFVDDRTWPVEVAYREEGRENWNHLRFEDIRTVDGYPFVGRRVHFNEEGGLTKVLYTHDFDYNPQINAEVFSKP